MHFPSRDKPRIAAHAANRAGSRRRVIVVCTHLRPSRDKRRSRYYMQPLTGLHIASLIDPAVFDVHLHHEDWHGPVDPTTIGGYDVAFLTGLQPDFDRMRQLAFYFRKSGATVIAGGSVCTIFPEFATEFFDVVCAGGVDTVRDAVRDYLGGSLRRIYRSEATAISDYAVDYRVFRRHGITPMLHLVESSRGCRFKCTFCVMPSEVGGHATYSEQQFVAALESSLDTRAWWTFQHWHPLVMLFDNNFSDDREHMLRVAALLSAHPRVRGWGALITQNVLQDRDTIAHLARCKCQLLFVGIESLDRDMLRRYKKTQNIGRGHNTFDDVAYAESQGIAICYGLMFDYRVQSVDDMRRQIEMIANESSMPMPVYLSVVAPLAGTESFWKDLEEGSLAPNLRFRDLDGETIAHRVTADSPEAVAAFIEVLFRRPWEVVSQWRILVKTIRRIRNAKTWNPVRWYVLASANFHCFVWSRLTPSSARTYRAGSDLLDPQYFERPACLDDADYHRYFEPITLTDANGDAAVWLRPYLDARADRRVRAVSFGA